MEPIIKYPSTRHLAGSGIQKGDSRETVPFSALRGEGVRVVYEEKVDGANAAFSFDAAGEPVLQSRGHALDIRDRSVFRERHFNHLKSWIDLHADCLLERFEDRYQVFGEWLGVTHSVFYDALPDLFLEFDILDKHTGQFLDTASRHALCAGLPITSVPVLYEGEARDLAHLRSLVTRSLYQTPDWRDAMSDACALQGDDFERRLAKMDTSDLAEGIYVKVEKGGFVVDRLKWVRETFVQTLIDGDEHWQSRFPVPNLLREASDSYPAFLARARPSVSP